ncbi:MAG: hypothetical protein LAT64_14620 [Phycisphaerales bacterium]|nr:hypothetical protein [Planctomycetota bacterium]MCH8509982.1 hypothetical protein [Phycisphaerales bacterium]
MRARTTLAAVVLAACAAYLGVHFLPGVFQSKPAGFALDPDQKQLLKDARAAYAAYPTITFTEATTAADIQAVLDAAPDQPVSPATAQIPATLTPEQARRHRAELSRLMAEFLLYAVSKDDADAYIAWRLGRGDRLMTIGELDRDKMLTDSWIYLTGGPPPDDLTSRDVFLFFHRRGRSERPPERRIVGILDHPDAAFTQLWFSNQHVSHSPPYPEPLGERGWAGSQLAGGAGYFRATVNRDNLYTINAPVLRARCGVIMVDHGGLRQPLMLHAFRSPADGHWTIDYVHTGNHDPETPHGMTW